MQPLAGKRALVTGAARGIGQAIALELAELGATLILTARDASTLSDTLAALPTGTDVTTLGLDLNDREGLSATLANLSDPIDILVNNAGLAPSAPAEKIKLETWDETYQVNVTAPFMVMQSVLPAMKERGWGRIVNVASTAGLIGYPFTAAYVSSKHAMIGLTRALAKELAKTGITVNAVCPGFTDTDIAKGAIENIKASGKTAEEAEKILARGNPMTRLIQPREVAQAVGLLCLDGSSSINGHALAVDGGEVIS